MQIFSVLCHQKISAALHSIWLAPKIRSFNMEVHLIADAQPLTGIIFM